MGLANKDLGNFTGCVVYFGRGVMLFVGGGWGGGGEGWRRRAHVRALVKKLQLKVIVILMSLLRMEVARQQREIIPKVSMDQNFLQSRC